MTTEQVFKAEAIVHLDLWIDDSNNSNSQTQILSEDSFGSLSGQSIFKNPSPNLVVDDRPLWDGKACHNVGSLQPFVYQSSIPAECDEDTPSSNRGGTRLPPSTQVSQDSRRHDSLTYSSVQHINSSWTTMVPSGTATSEEVLMTYAANRAAESLDGIQLGQQVAALDRDTADDPDRWCMY